MKRLVWLLIVTFLTAVSQVQAVDVRLIPAEEKCCCCDENAGACGMPDCLPAAPAACPQPVVQLASPVQAVAKRSLPARAGVRETFYAQFLPRPCLAPALPVVAGVAVPAASVPRFKEHCSFLI